MFELILVRHAKSDWGDPDLPDHERPLNARGSRDAPMMARVLAESGARVDRLLSSTAVRARTTAEVFAARLGVEPELDRELYLASASTLWEQATSAGASSVMVVAHDPGLSELAWTLSAGGIEHMPTCAVARFIWEAESPVAHGRWAASEIPAPTRWSLSVPREHTG